MMNRSSFRFPLIALSAAFSFSALPAWASGADAVIATVNGKSIPQSRADVLVNAQIASGQADTPALRNMIKDELIRREILTQESIKSGFEKKADVLPQLMLARQSVLIQAYVSDFVRKHPATEDAMKKEYDAVKSRLGDKEYKVRHILVKTQDEAGDIIAKLVKGEKFEELAKQSIDPSKERGGELGWAAPSNFVKPFADAMVLLEKGRYSTAPVQSEYGFHVIQVDDVRDLKLPSFDEAKPQIMQHLQHQAIEKHIADLRKAATVK